MPITPGGNVAIAQDPDGNLAFLQGDADGKLITAGGGGAVDLTGDVTSVGAATTIVAPNGLPVTAISKKATDATACLPITLYVKDVAVLTSGAPADIATITLPAGITRAAIYAAVDEASVTKTLGSAGIVETASGSLAAAAIYLFDGPAGTGNNVGSFEYSLGTAGSAATPTFGATSPVVISGPIYVNQQEVSANAGTVSFYITIYPLP